MIAAVTIGRGNNAKTITRERNLRKSKEIAEGICYYLGIPRGNGGMRGQRSGKRRAQAAA